MIAILDAVIVMVFKSSTDKKTQPLQNRFWTWVDRRSPVSPEHKLTHKNLYILPTERGLFFLGITFILWLIGTNYQNNLVLALSFLMLSIFLVSILHTFDNLVHLTFQYKGVDDVFAGSDANFEFAIHSKKKRWSDTIELSWQNAFLPSVCISIPPSRESILVELPLHTEKRGWITAGRMCVKSGYPLGLFRCWTWLRWDAQVLVYPDPVAAEQSPFILADDVGDGMHPVSGGNDYTGLRTYHIGDTPKHIAWKVYAREQGLYVKEFSQNVSQERWLDFDSVTVSGVEEKLSALCFWALYFHREDENYGLRMPNLTIPPDKGDAHKRKVLVALATHGLAEYDSSERHLTSANSRQKKRKKIWGMQSKHTNKGEET